MKGLVFTLDKKYDSQNNIIGDNIIEIYENEFDVSGAFFWIDLPPEINTSGDLYYSNDGLVKEYIVDQEMSPIDPSITDGDLLV
jgi:hypothetical protein